MKKITLAILLIVTAAFADKKLDFAVAMDSYGCEVVKWIENDYESGVYWKHYAKVACKEKQKLPLRVLGLRYLDISMNLRGEFIYTYGEE